MGFRAAHTCAKMATSGARDKFTPTHPPKDAVCDHHTAALCSFPQTETENHPPDPNRIQMMMKASNIFIASC